MSESYSSCEIRVSSSILVRLAASQVLARYVVLPHCPHGRPLGLTYRLAPNRSPTQMHASRHHSKRASTGGAMQPNEPESGWGVPKPA